MLALLQHRKTGLFFAAGKHFTVTKQAATPLNVIEAAIVKASAPGYVVEVPYQPAMQVTDDEFFGRRRVMSPRRRRAEAVKSYLLSL